MRGLYIGRFQPFHNGHKAVAEYIAEEADELIVGIGSPQISHEPLHPFTAGERILMITQSLADLKIPYYVLPVTDVYRNAIWVSHVISMVPKFDVVYSSNPQVIRLFEEAGIEVHSPPMYDRDRLSGTAIRELMKYGGNWEELIPKEAAEVIRSIGGIRRIQQISQSDE
ncbi:MAG: nicotinamide-nucleotide adenylyltransferase [Methanocorpusculum sp.]|nr:nicotinamide-nucleotide adenylyltransferase [Methanocorpusculum sp.]